MNPLDDLPPAICDALSAFDPDARLIACHNASMAVSTNRVYRLTFENNLELFAKLSSYGSFVHFREDHQLIHQWRRHLQHTRFAQFLAAVATRSGEPFTYRRKNEWVAFYEKVPFYDFLPRRLSLDQVDAMGRELASFHLESARTAQYMDGSWKSMGSDIARLYDLLNTPEFLAGHGLDEAMGEALKRQCDRFLEQAGALGYHRMLRIPVLVDWNTSNFSVGLDRDGFKFFSRWDYDWFRLEPRALDFYFCARVVRDEGDRTVFTYSPQPLFETRFLRFLRAYHSVYPLTEQDIRFIPECYRFFLLNYLVRVGDHFFRPEIRQRLTLEAAERYLPLVDRLDFRKLLDCLERPGGAAPITS